jgi:hypothetical protein
VFVTPEETDDELPGVKPAFESTHVPNPTFCTDVAKPLFPIMFATSFSNALVPPNTNVRTADKFATNGELITNAVGAVPAWFANTTALVVAFNKIGFVHVSPAPVPVIPTKSKTPPDKFTGPDPVAVNVAIDGIRSVPADTVANHVKFPVAAPKVKIPGPALVTLCKFPEAVSPPPT